MRMKTIHNISFGSSKDLHNVNDESIHLVITSPPYPMIEMWDEQFSQLNPKIKRYLDQGEGKEAFELMHLELDNVWHEIFRVLKDGGIICINIGDATRKIGDLFQLFSNHSRILTYFLKLGFVTLPPILWHKTSTKPNKFMGSGMLPTNAYITHEHEFILILRKGNNRIFNNDQKELRYHSAYFWEERNSWFSDIWFDLKGIPQNLNDSDERTRSAAFPFELAYRLINMYSIQGDTILDPFLGTGTTTIAAITSMRNSIGYEIDKSFKQIIQDRLKYIIRFASEYINERLEKHRNFIEEQRKKDKLFKYKSEVYDFEIVTNQETKILFPLPIEIKEITDFKFIIEYLTEIK